MAPLILHNVPEDELYVGDDGIQRPYAMVFPQDGHHSTLSSAATTRRRGPAESGSFGKSTRRTRSRTATPAIERKGRDATLDAADKLFGNWVSANSQATADAAGPTSRKSSLGHVLSAADGSALDDGATSAAVAAAAAAAASTTTAPISPGYATPTEVLLRGYRSPQQQYAAINHYEQLAGRICEDYAREPPAELRRYRSELRDRAYTAHRALSTDERVLVNCAAGGDHWVKVTFESAEAADAAVFASPQRILGHLVHAEFWTGAPPPRDEPLPDTDALLPAEDSLGGLRARSMPQLQDTLAPEGRFGRRAASTAALGATASGIDSPGSRTLTSEASAESTGTLRGRDDGEDLIAPQDSLFCRRIPTARRAQLLPAEQALLPHQSAGSQLASVLLRWIPVLGWLSMSMIGNEVPRTEAGEFDWARASLYWRVICWLDVTFGLFGGEILSADKDE